MELLLLALAVLLVALGLAGTVLPALPGVLLVYAGLFVAAWADGFERVGPVALVLLALLTLFAYVVEFAAGAYGTKRTGASPRAVWGAALGALVGIFFGLPGIVFGPFAGAVLGEYTVRRKLGEAGRAGAGAWLGLVLAAALKIALAFAMIGFFAIAFAL